MPNFRKELFPDYKANRDNRTKVVIYTYEVEGGWSGVVKEVKAPDILFNVHVSDREKLTDRLRVLYLGLLGICGEKRLKPVRHEHHCDGQVTVKRLG